MKALGETRQAQAQGIFLSQARAHTFTDPTWLFMLPGVAFQTRHFLQDGEERSSQQPFCASLGSGSDKATPDEAATRESLLSEGATESTWLAAIQLPLQRALSPSGNSKKEHQQRGKQTCTTGQGRISELLCLFTAGRATYTAEMTERKQLGAC